MTWDQPAFGAKNEPDWHRPPPTTQREVARVVWHGGTDAVWVDPVFEARQPDVVFVTVDEAARGAAREWQCQLKRAHRFAERRIWHGYPVSSFDAAGLAQSDSTLTLLATDGSAMNFGVEPATLQVCQRCGTLYVFQHEGWRERLPKSRVPQDVFTESLEALPWLVRALAGLQVQPTVAIICFLGVLALLVGGPTGLGPWVAFGVAAVLVLGFLMGVARSRYLAGLIDRGARFNIERPLGRLPDRLAQ